MRKTIIGIILVSMLTYIALCNLLLRIRVKSLKQELRAKESEINLMHLHIVKLNACIAKLYKIKTQARSNRISPVVLEAVKYAMVKNHPDNGGSVEKFMLYRDCYEKLKEGIG